MVEEMTTIDEDFYYVTNSLRRMDVMYILDSVGFARGYEMADILCTNASTISLVTKNLHEHDLITSKKVGRFKIHSLTDKGKQVVQKMKDYHGVN